MDVLPPKLWVECDSYYIDLIPRQSPLFVLSRRSLAFFVTNFHINTQYWHHDQKQLERSFTWPLWIVVRACRVFSRTLQPALEPSVQSTLHPHNNFLSPASSVLLIPKLHPTAPQLGLIALSVFASSCGCGHVCNSWLSLHTRVAARHLYCPSG